MGSRHSSTASASSLSRQSPQRTSVSSETVTSLTFFLTLLQIIKLIKTSGTFKDPGNSTYKYSKFYVNTGPTPWTGYRISKCDSLRCPLRGSVQVSGVMYKWIEVTGNFAPKRNFLDGETTGIDAKWTVRQDQTRLRVVPLSVLKCLIWALILFIKEFKCKPPRLKFKYFCKKITNYSDWCRKVTLPNCYCWAIGETAYSYAWLPTVDAHALPITLMGPSI